MAVGDVVTGISGTGVALTFQPAAGVEVLITSYFGDGSGLRMTVGNGSVNSNCGCTASDVDQDPTNMKVFIDNTNYLDGDLSAGKNTAYSGIVVG